MLLSRLLNPSGMAVSIAMHLAVLTVGLGYAGVRPFETISVEAIAVDILSPEEVKDATAKTPPIPPPPLAIPDSFRDTPAMQPAMSSTASMAATADSRDAAIQRPPAAATAVSAAAARQPATSWRPPEPDLSVKYQVNLGLPALRSGDFDAVAFSAAKVSTDDVAKFREHLKTCLVLPDSVAPTDKVTIRLRASFLPDGTLASAPLLIEATASAKGPLLMRAAIDALAACQPHTALPADKYTEWKVLDLAFTPRDFRGG
jgi:hypothetical protein